MTIILLLDVKYSTPLKVLLTTEISEVIACFNELLVILNIPSTKLKLLFSSIKNISFLINSYTKFFLNSGAIYNAFTLNDNNTSIIPSIFLS